MKEYAWLRRHKLPSFGWAVGLSGLSCSPGWQTCAGPAHRAHLGLRACRCHRCTSWHWDWVTTTLGCTLKQFINASTMPRWPWLSLARSWLARAVCGHGAAGATLCEQVSPSACRGLVLSDQLRLPSWCAGLQPVPSYLHHTQPMFPHQRYAIILFIALLTG